MIRALMLAGVLAAAVPVWAGEPGLFDSPCLAMVNEDDALFDAWQREVPAPTAEIYHPFGARGGLFWPGASSETGDFGTGLLVGAYGRMRMPGGMIECSLDVTALNAPDDLDASFQFLALGGLSYFYNWKDWYAGGGITLANATPISEMMLVQAAGGMRLFGQADLTLTLYYPAGNTNNSLFAAVTFGYRF
ncbi:MAG: hypothetical protein ABIF71_12385 [Planctomycetota bacterium]